MLYCFAISVVYSDYVNATFTSISNSGTERYDAPVISNLFSYTSQYESSVKTFNNTPPFTFKNSLNGFWASVRTAQKLITTEFTQFNSVSRNFPIKLRKVDIIFPFQYFW